jgi:DNA ligase (NAD+)
LRKALLKAKQTTLDRFLVALGIPLVGEHLAGVLAAHYQDLEPLMDADEQELLQISEIGPEVAGSIASFFNEKHNAEAIKQMLDDGLVLENSRFAGSRKPLPFAGLKFVFTGSLTRWTRDEAKHLVERLGGRATASVSKETDYVVAGPGAGAKLEQAKKLAIPILSEAQFQQYLDRQNG